MDAFDFRHDLILPLLSFGRCSLEPFVKRRARDLKHTAKDRDRPAMLVLRDESKSQPLSFAKKAVAFFKISRSILS